jgi:hypothetical protein
MGAPVGAAVVGGDVPGGTPPFTVASIGVIETLLASLIVVFFGLFLCLDDAMVVIAPGAHFGGMVPVRTGVGAKGMDEANRANRLH